MTTIRHPKVWETINFFSRTHLLHDLGYGISARVEDILELTEIFTNVVAVNAGVEEFVQQSHFRDQIFLRQAIGNFPATKHSVVIRSDKKIIMIETIL